MRLLTGGPALDKKLVKLVESYEHISFAVAWASTGTASYRALLQHRNRIHRAVIGTHFFQTAPDVLDDFIKSKSVRFILQPDGVFHPKAFLFWNADEWELVIGSANLTAGGLGKNSELMLNASSRTAPPKLMRDVQKQIEMYWRDADVISEVQAVRYRDLWKVNRPFARKLAATYGQDEKSDKPATSKIMAMNWPQYSSAIRKRGVRESEERFALLECFAEAFRHHQRFRDMDHGLRRAIAGLPNKEVPNWGWFGNMQSNWEWQPVVNKQYVQISKALSLIPLQGPVSVSHFDSYISAFVKAFPRGRHGVGVASRLLAMKRPDYFVCISGKNLPNLCKAFGIKKSGMNFRRYWDEVICRIVDSVWWNEPKPNSVSAIRAWKFRAAMLDAIYYEPDFD